MGGIALFALGFIVTISSLPNRTEMLGSSAEGFVYASSSSASLLVGFVASLAGLGIATIGPAVIFMRARRAKV